jgi:calcineurin-like phosphoesterase family protein
VGPHDDVWHLGDFALGIDAAAEARIFRRLKGRKHLIMGNHDENRLKSLPWSSPVHEIKMINVGPQRVVLSHYAMRSWPGIHRGAVNLYGHTHASLEDTTMSCDVGVDAWSFRPISLDECLQRMSMATIVPEEILLARAGKKGLDDDA